MKFSTMLCLSILLCVSSIAQADPRAWGDTGMPIRQGLHLKWNQGMARDANGNTLLVWTEKGTGQRDVRAQLINSSGQPQWNTGGVNVTQELHFQDSPVTIATEGGWIIAWVDFRDSLGCPYYWDYYTCASVYAQKLDYSGNRLWSDNDFTGVVVNPNVEGFDKFSLRIVSDAQGGAMLAWNEYHIENGIHAQRITASGSVAWPQSTQVSDSDNVRDLRTVPGSDGSMLIAWVTYENYVHGVRLSRVMPDGTLPWGSSGIVVSNNPSSRVRIAPDGSNGCYVVWTESQVYAQHLNEAGQPLWAEHGIPISTGGTEADPDMALSMSGGEVDGIVAVWSHNEQQNQYTVYAQKVAPEGSMSWTDGGLALANLGANGWRASPTVTTDHNGGLVALWQDNSGAVPHCLAARVGWDGTLAWGTNPVPAGDPLAPSTNSYYYAPSFGMAGDFGTYFVAYVGVDSLGMEGVRMQLLDHASGTRLLDPNGVAAVSGVGGEAGLAQIAPMSNYRTAVFWTDGRFGQHTWSGPLYYQIVEANGQIQRTANGERLVPNNSGSPYVGQHGPRTCDDGAGGLFVSYADGRTVTPLIRVSHLSASGDLIGPDSGMVLWWEEGMLDQDNAFICSDGNEGCFVAWTGYESDYSQRTYVMRLNSDLQRVWNQPVQLLDTLTGGYIQGLVAGGDYCCIAATTYGSYSDRNILATGICGDGTIAWHDTICDAPGNQVQTEVVSDDQGGAYVVWRDSRTAQNDEDLYAQRIAGDGTPYWAADGIPVYAGQGSQSNPQITLDSGGNLCVVWTDTRDNNNAHIYAQRLSPQGIPLWDEDGVRVNNTYTYAPKVAASSRDGIFAIWGYYSRTALAMHLDSTGAIFDDPFWRPDTGGVVAEPIFEHELTENPLAVSDGWGGCVASWTKAEAEYEFYPDRGGEVYTADIYVQRLFDYTNSARRREDPLPHEYALYQNYPNPFNPVTQIRFDLPQAGSVKLVVYDLLGRRVAALVEGKVGAGQHQVSLDASNFTSGIYFYRLEVGSFMQSKKLVVLK